MNLGFSHFYGRAFAAMEKGRTKEAGAWLQAAERYVKTEEEQREWLRAQALWWDQQEKLSEAATCYEAILTSDDRDAGAWFGLASIADRQGRQEVAEAGYLQALALDPAYDRASFFLADLYDEQGKTELALHWYRYTCVQAPEDAMAYRNMGAICQRQKRWIEATWYMEQALRLDPQSYELWLFLGSIWQQRGEYRRALSFYLGAQRIDPTREEFYLNVSAMRLEQNRPLDSLRILNEGLRYLPQAVRLQYNRACTLVKLGNPSLGLEALRHTIALDARSAQWAREDPDFQALRQHPMYAAAMQAASSEEIGESRRRKRNE